VQAAWHGSQAGIKLQNQTALNAAYFCIRDADLTARPERVRSDVEQIPPYVRLFAGQVSPKAARAPLDCGNQRGEE
jgi:hypothetical protein